MTAPWKTATGPFWKVWTVPCPVPVSYTHLRAHENGYRAFLESLDGALSSAVQEMGAYEGTDNLADAAVHFGLLSYAAGLVSRQYVAQLRARTKPAGKPDKAEAKKAAKSRKERKD